MKKIPSKRLKGTLWIVVLLFVLASFIPAWTARAGLPAAQAQQTEPAGSWKLVSSSQSDEWQGDNFHGLKSEYSPIFNGDTIGAVYTQYNILFTADAKQTFASELTGLCAWSWDGGGIPSEVVPGKSYPFILAVDANATGPGFLGGTVNGYTLTSQSQGSIAFAQVYLDVSGQVRTGHQETSASLALSPGQNEGEQTTVTALCQVDIVSVRVDYLYEWGKTGCSATLALPDGMKPGQEFTPQVTVVDSQQRTVKPDKESWFYNGAPSSNRMKWDGKAATVAYEYVCPGETALHTAQIAVPAAPSCTATIVIPDPLEQNKTFTARATVVDPGNKPVVPEKETWFYNGLPSSSSMKWDGKAATIDYEYVCPLDQQPGKASRQIPPAEEGSGWQIVVGGLAVVAAAGLAAVAGGAALIKSSGKKGPPPPKYILQLNKRSLEVTHKQSAALFIRAWKINPDGSTVPAPEAAIQVSVPSSPAGLAASPVSGVGSLECTFSVPLPKECLTVPVAISASAGLMSTAAQVLVQVVPVYELELSWHDPQQRMLKPEGKEIYARARLTATPKPDPQITPDQLAAKIVLSLEGPNHALVQMASAPPALQKPYVRDGVLWIPLRAPAAPAGSAESPGNPILAARFNEGSQRLEKKLTLELSAGLVLGAWVQGKRRCDVLYDPRLATPGWDFTEIITYFHEPEKDSLPVHPAFAFGLDRQSIEFDPPVMEVIEIFSHARDQYTIQVRLTPGTDLEQYFGSDLSGRNGIIQARITVKADDGKAYSNTVSYCLRPKLEIFAHGAEPEGRTYKGLDLKAEDFTADGSDRLTVSVAVCRTDKVGTRKIGEVDLVDPSCWTFSATLTGGSSAEYLCERGEESEASEPLVFVRSQRPRLHQQTGPGESLTLHLEATPTSALPGNYLRTPLSFDLPIQPRLLGLRLWVVPGKHRGTSEAWMFAYLDRDPNLPLPEVVLKLKTENAGGGGPELLTNNLSNETGVVTGADGSEQVELTYRGLNWSNLDEARFIVSCSLVSDRGDQESEPVKVAINVKENVSLLLADLLDRAEMLKLNNPYYENRSLGLTSLLDLTVSRPFVRGPVWNTCEQFSGNESAYARGDKKAKFAHDYVCSEFRDRVAEWLIRRRHYQAGSPERIEQIARMNGIEFEHFTVASGLHNYEALFLSGMAPTDDPRAGSLVETKLDRPRLSLSRRPDHQQLGALLLC